MPSELPSCYCLRQAANASDYKSFSRLARAYAAQLHVDLDFQQIDEELASLPGTYASPKGCIIIMSYEDCNVPGSVGQDVACVAVRPLQLHTEPTVCDNIAACRAELAAPTRNTADQCNSGINCVEEQQQPAAQSKYQQQDGSSSSVESQLSNITCELKRLWVEPEHQHEGIGRVLLDEALQVARKIGYQRMVLETLESLPSANRLYDEAGFCRTCHTH